MKRGGLIILVFLIIIHSYSVIATESSIPSNFTLLGCAMNNEFLLYNSCSRYGLFWCDNSGELQDVFIVKDSCKGNNLISAEDDCCPPSYYCDSSSGVCKPREYECSKFNQKNPCEENGCIWWTEDYPERCIDRRQLSSCSDYKKNSTCTRDLYGLGRTNGLGTDACQGIYIGTKLTIVNSCKCKWDGLNETTGNCSITYDIIDELDPYKIFTCNKYFSLSECTNNQQIVNWIVSSNSNGLTLTEEELTKLKCTNGNKVISCGYSLVKLPFFNGYNLIISIITISLIYFYQQKNEKI